jgi:cytochrome c oxidase cbb3-type subunit 3
MPPFPLPDEQIWQLAAFVRSLNAPAISLPVQGDVQAGEAIFFGKGECASCHMVRGRGGYLGPDLSNVGATRRMGELRESLTDPSLKASADFQPVLLRDSQGQQLRGIAKHASPWSAQVLDERGGLHLLHDDELQKLSFQERSWMARDFAARLSSEEITNLIAFLSRQALRPPSPPEGDKAVSKAAAN